MESARIQPTRQDLKIISINITEKFKKKDVDTYKIKHEEDNVLDSLEQQDVAQITQSADLDFDVESEQYDEEKKKFQINATELTDEHVKKGPLKQPVMRQAKKLDALNTSSEKVQNQDISEFPKFSLQWTQKEESFD